MALFGSKQQQPGRVAVNFAARGARFAQVECRAANKPKVMRCEFQLLPLADAAALGKLRKEYKLGGYACSHLLRAGEYKLLLVDAPEVPAAELKTALRWKVKDLLDYPVEQATIDALAVPVSKDSASRSRSVYAVAAPNDTIRERMAAFDGAGFRLDAIDVPELAQRNIAALYEHDERGVAMLSFGPEGEGGLLTFTAGGALYLARRIDIGAWQLQDANEDIRKQHLERLVLELQRSLDYFDRQFHAIPLSRLLLAPFVGAAELRDYLVHNLYVGVERLNLNEAFDFSAVPDLVDNAETQADFLPLLGAALRV